MLSPFYVCIAVTSFKTGHSSGSALIFIVTSSVLAVVISVLAMGIIFATTRLVIMKRAKVPLAK